MFSYATIHTLRVNCGRVGLLLRLDLLHLALCARRVLSGVLTLGDLVAIHGILLQLQQPLNALAFTYQEIRTSLTDMRQLLALLQVTPQVTSPADAPLPPSDAPLDGPRVRARRRVAGVHAGRRASPRRGPRGVPHDAHAALV